MPFTYKLSRRLARLLTVATAAISLGCNDSPTSPADERVVRPANSDPALAVTSSSAVGQRVTADRYIQIFSGPSRSASVIGSQAPGARGTVLEGPTAITSAEPYALFRVNFDTGVDGWTLGAYISLVPQAPVATIAVAPTSATVAIAGTVQLSATLRDAAGAVLTGRAVTWSSSNAAVANVSTAGLVTGIAGGTSTVTATSEGRSASALITVPSPIVVASISVTPATATLAVAGTVQLSATTRDASGAVLTGRAVSWTSSNAAVATVSATGVVTAIAAGTSTVTATSEGRSATVAITVTAPITVASISLTPTSASIAVSGLVQLVPTVRDAAGNVLTGRTITWSSSNPSVATVTAGSVSGIAAGTATITATSEGRSATATISVQAPVPPPPSASTVFSSRWTSATGTSQSAFLDASSATPWGFVCCSGNTNSSIATASSLGLQKWPAGNVYRVGTQASVANAINTHVIQRDLGSPAANSHRYFRYYLQVAYGDGHGAASEGNIEHGVETAATTNAGGRGMNFYRIPRNDGTWFPGYRDIASGVRYIGSNLRLLKNRTYRMEWHLAYGPSTYTVQVRIYNEDGVLVATENDFFQLTPNRNVNALLGAYNFSYSAGDHRYFRVGTNGPSSNFPMQNMRDENLFLHGAVAVCSTNWCGPVAP